MTVESIVSRRSIRRYERKDIPQSVLIRLLTSATAAPSAHNRQPWRFVVLTDAHDKDNLARTMGEHLRNDRMRDGDPIEAVEADVARSYARLTQAPVVIVVALTLEDMDSYPDAKRSQAERIMAIQSTAMAVQNLLLSAEAEKLGACWLCAPLFCAQVVRRTLELAPHWEPQAIVTLGYPANAGKPYSRRPLSDVVRFRNTPSCS